MRHYALGRRHLLCASFDLHSALDVSFSPSFVKQEAAPTSLSSALRYPQNLLPMSHQEQHGLLGLVAPWKLERFNLITSNASWPLGLFARKPPGEIPKSNYARKLTAMKFAYAGCSTFGNIKSFSASRCRRLLMLRPVKATWWPAPGIASKTMHSRLRDIRICGDSGYLPH
jgi:hypothetical protein